MQPPPNLFDTHPARFDQQLTMVAHQDIGVNLKPVSLAIVFQTVQIILPIRITAEYDLPLIGPSDHMVKRSGKFHSRLARHLWLRSAAWPSGVDSWFDRQAEAR
jgi:hypothetical protein